MVVAGNTLRSDASPDEELHQRTLHLRLSTLEVIPTEEDAVTMGKFNKSRTQGVLWGTVDVATVLQDSGHRIEYRGCNFTFVTSYCR